MDEQRRTRSARHESGYGSCHGQSRAKPARRPGVIWRTSGRWCPIWAGATYAAERSGRDDWCRFPHHAATSASAGELCCCPLRRRRRAARPSVPVCPGRCGLLALGHSSCLLKPACGLPGKLYQSTLNLLVLAILLCPIWGSLCRVASNPLPVNFILLN